MRCNLPHIAVILLCLLTLSFNVIEAKPKMVVVIDPGHGGGDVGTPHRRYKQDEKTIALNVALRLGRLIEWNYNDVKVVYTRKTDVYPSLPNRVEKAKDAKGDLFISIHVNACPDAAARGFETYVFGTDGSDSGKKRVEERLVEERENLDISGRRVNFDTDIDIETKILCQAQREKHNKQSLEVAKAVQSQLISTLKKSSYASNVKNRGVKAKNLFVLCFAPMPAILVELGYMSNVNEEKFIASDEGQECFADAIFKGFKEYKAKWDKRQLSNQGGSVAPETPVATVQPVTNEKVEKKSDKKPAATVEAKPTVTTEPRTNNSATPKVESKPVAKTETATTPKESKTETKATPKSYPAPQKVEAVKADNPDKVVWKIQFLTSAKILKEGAPELKGLKNVSYYKDGAVYKYTYGSADNTKDLSTKMKEVRGLFDGAFFVKFDSKGNRIK